MNLSSLLQVNSRKYRDKEALVFGEQRLTFHEWNEAVNKLAHSLLEIGIQKGDRVVLYMPNTIEFVIAYFATIRLGAIIVPINAKLTKTEVSFIIEHCKARAFIVHEWLFQNIKNWDDEELICIKTGSQKEGWFSFEQLQNNKTTTSEINNGCSEDEEVSILYTSGTTGNPKGVLFTHKNILTVATMICIEMNVNVNSRLLHMMPLSHSAPLHLFLMSGVMTGATHILLPTFDPKNFLTTIQNEKITHFFGAPVVFTLTAKTLPITDYDLSSVQKWIYGGAPLTVNEFNFIQEAFQTTNFTCVYGLTEAGPNGTLLDGEDHILKAGSIGNRAALNCEIRIVDEEGKDVEIGEIGEIILKGEGTMKGYYQAEEQTKESFTGEWLKSGDLAKVDEDGFYWIVDRKKDVIISGGVNIYPKEVEELLLNIPMIREVAVVGIHHDIWGETVKAFLVVDAQTTDYEDLCKCFLGGKLASYKIPRLYEVVNELPRNATGKILKTLLKIR